MGYNLFTKYACILFLFFSAGVLYAQTDSLGQLLAEFEEDGSPVLELIEDLSQHPVNINSESRDELQRIPLISSWQIDSIIAYRTAVGNFKSKRQIRFILTPEIYELVKDFISTKPYKNHQGQLVHKSYYLIDPPPELLSGTYKGNSFYNLNKLYYSANNNIKGGVVTHKDPGEKSYLDFYSAYLSFEYGRHHLIAGSYYFRFGEGLIFSNGFGQQKSSSATMPFRSLRPGGTPSLSSSENNGFNGLYTKFQAGTFLLHMFYSNQYRDAQMTIDFRDITGFDPDGYHRTDSELYKKNRIHEICSGTAINYTLFNKIETGAAISRVTFSPAINFNINTVGENAFRRQYYKFSGSGLNLFSFYYNANFKPFTITSEFSGSNKGSPGFVQSFLFNENNFSFGVKYWHITKNFLSPYGRIFDNASMFPQGEQGYYISLGLKPFQYTTVTLYKIFKKDLWRPYFDNLPLAQDETFIEVNTRLKKAEITTRLRIKDRETLSAPTESQQTHREIQRQFISRIQLDFKPRKDLRFKTRWESTNLPGLEESGTALFEDIHFTVNKDVSFSSRILLYRTDSYNSRIYQYESDLPGSFANYAVYGEGYLWYFLIRYTITSRFSFYLKYRYNLQIYKDLTKSRLLKQENDLDRLVRFQLTMLL